MVEAVRSGMIFARDNKAYKAWRRKTRKASDAPIGLTGQSLESAIGALAYQHPEYVVIGGR